jgi:hypothetical protein
MTAPALTEESVTVGFAPMPQDRYNRNHFHVFRDGRKVGEMWRYGTDAEPRWRAYREDHGTSVANHPTREAAAAAVGWRIQIRAYQLVYQWVARKELRLVSPGGDVALIVLAQTHDDLVSCTAIVSGDTVQQILNEGGCAAVRRHVAAAFGVTCIGGGQRGSTGDPVVLFSIPAGSMVTLQP